MTATETLPFAPPPPPVPEFEIGDARGASEWADLRDWLETYAAGYEDMHGYVMFRSECDHDIATLAIRDLYADA